MAAAWPDVWPVGRLAAVMLGGITGVRQGEREFTQLADQLAAFAEATGARLALVPSRRTPVRACEVCVSAWWGALGTEAVWVWDGDLTGGPDVVNPYPGVLGLADYLIVTSDSVNMVSEAAITGKPLLTAEMVH